MRNSILVAALSMLLAVAFIGCAVDVSTAQEATPAPAQQVGQPSIDWEETAPPVYPTTGCKVLWNDSRRVYEYFFAGTDWLMARPEVAFKDAEPDAVLLLTHPSSLGNHYRHISATSGTFNRAAYEQKYAATLDSFIGYHLLLTDGKNVPLPRAVWLAALDWDTDAGDGYGRKWYWIHGLAANPGLHTAVVRHRTCYHVAAGSQDTTTSKYLILPLP